MTHDHPTIAEQMEAVEWAELFAAQIAKNRAKSGDPHVTIDKVHRRLEAAAETLRTLEYGSAIAR